MLDDIIWECINKISGRVLLIFDCCHAETMFRNPGIQFKAFAPREISNTNISMICWSGCPDNASSYGSREGGKFTLTINEHFSPLITYDKLWNKILNDKSLKKS